ncbi:MAG: chemotaxis protein CheC [Sulfuricellaceae bacterium]|nr:chemotaxis protein CheC [Sulfuricellaceae bacterium]
MLERNSLTELTNIGLNRAATQLSSLLNDTISIGVPKVEIVPVEEVLAALAMPGEEDVACVWQRLNGQVDGTAMLVFHLDGTRKLVNALIGSVPILAGVDLRAYEHEAMTEIGNIIISSGISVFSDLIRGEIELSVPTYGEHRLGDLIAAQAGSHEPRDLSVIIILAQLRASQQNVSGCLVLLLSVRSVASLMQGLKAEMQRSLDASVA